MQWRLHVMLEIGERGRVGEPI